MEQYQTSPSDKGVAITCLINFRQTIMIIAVQLTYRSDSFVRTWIHSTVHLARQDQYQQHGRRSSCRSAATCHHLCMDLWGACPVATNSALRFLCLGNGILSSSQSQNQSGNRWLASVTRRLPAASSIPLESVNTSRHAFINSDTVSFPRIITHSDLEHVCIWIIS